jgi:hypothetical protein
MLNGNNKDCFSFRFFNKYTEFSYFKSDIKTLIRTVVAKW